MKKLLMAVAAVAAFGAFGKTYYVDGSVTTSGDGSLEASFKTIAEGIGAASSEAVDTVQVAAGDYPITETIVLGKGVIVQGAGRATTTIDAQLKCRAVEIGHADAVLRGFTIKNGKGTASGASAGSSGSVVGSGILFTSKGGKAEDVRVTGCTSGSNDCRGMAVAICGPGTLENAVVDGNTAGGRFGWHTGGGGGLAVYLAHANAVMRNVAVVDNTYTGYGQSMEKCAGAVHLAQGTVENCTIANNKLFQVGGLLVDNNAAAIVRNTICWGNTAITGKSGAGEPNFRIEGSSPTVTGLCAPAPWGADALTANPRFVDAANKDYSLSPGSPCLAAGIGAIGLGTTAPVFGIAVDEPNGVDSLTTVVRLVGYNGADASSASVVWKVNGVIVEGETGPEFEYTFTGGEPVVSAEVTVPGDAAVTVEASDAVHVGATDVYVDEKATGSVPPYASAATAAKTIDAALPYMCAGSTMHILKGTYQNTQPIFITTNMTFQGEDANTNVVVKRSGNSGIFFVVAHPQAVVSNLTMTGTGTSCGGALRLRDGLVYGCRIVSNKGSASTNGQGVYMDGAKTARLSHSLVASNGNNNESDAAGVYLQAGLVDNCLIRNNISSRGNGAGVLMCGSNTKLLNCTIVDNESKTWTGKGLGGGVMRNADCGTVVNCIIWGNKDASTSAGAPNWYSSDAAKNPKILVVNAFTNCCTTVSGSGVLNDSNKIVQNRAEGVVAPFVENVYTLPQGSVCIDAGRDDDDQAAFDYFSVTRVLRGATAEQVDIGCSEYKPPDVFSASFTCEPKTSFGPVDAKLTGVAQGDGHTPEDFVYKWTFDDDPTEFVGQEVTHHFDGKGNHRVTMRVYLNGEPYGEPVEGDGVGIYGDCIYVAVPGTVNAQFPYDTPETAHSNLSAVVEMASAETPIRLLAGNHPVTKMIQVSKPLTLTGAGRDETVVYCPDSSRLTVFCLNNPEALVESLTVSNGIGSTDGGYSGRGGCVVIADHGGWVRNCRLCKGSGNSNQGGGGAYITGADSRISETIFENNSTAFTSTKTQPCYGGGVWVDNGAKVENCVIRGNKAYSGGGAFVNGGTLCNCTVVGNWAENPDKVSPLPATCVGGVRCDGGSVVNCIVIGNWHKDRRDEDAEWNVSGKERFFNCFTPKADWGEKGICGTLEDVLFRDYAGGDYRISSYSPCVRSGRYQADWMPGRTDFYGKPRTTPCKHVDIGCAQSPDPGLMLLVR